MSMGTNKGRWATAFVQILLGMVASVVALIAVLPILLAALPFWLVAKLTRVLLPLFKSSVVGWPDLFEFHPHLGWKAKSNFSAHCLEERDDVFQVSTDADGWPGNRTLDESKIVVFGDSHAFGYGVDTKRAFFSIADVAIKAIGAPGYNMVQEILLMEELAPSLKGKLVVMFVCYGNDLYDNLAPEMGGYRTPFVTKANGSEWRIVTHHIDESKWSASSGRQGRQRTRVPEKLFRKSFLGDRAFSASEFLIGKGKEICQRAGAEFVVMTIPTPAMLEPLPSVYGKNINAEYPDQTIRDTCRKLNVPVLCLKDHLSRGDYKSYDEHWSECGHRKVAGIIASIYGAKFEPRNQRLHVTSINQNTTAACSQSFSAPL